MKDERHTYQVHANVNAYLGDAALRVTITHYDEGGHQVAHHTWRKHVRDLTYDGIDWQAYSAVTELVKMMAEVCSSPRTDVEADVPLF